MEGAQTADEAAGAAEGAVAAVAAMPIVIGVEEDTIEASYALTELEKSLLHPFDDNQPLRANVLAMLRRGVGDPVPVLVSSKLAEFDDDNVEIMLVAPYVDAFVAKDDGGDTYTFECNSNAEFDRCLMGATMVSFLGYVLQGILPRPPPP